MDLLEGTIEDRYKINVLLKRKNFEIEILDTGEDDFQFLYEVWISFGECFLLVFAINDKESFDFVKKIYKNVKKKKYYEKCPILLVGNKSDLEKERKIKYSDAEELANSWGIEYIETSVKNNINCKEVFIKVAEKVAEKKIEEERRRRTIKCNIF